jgi:hypothetical protein
MTERDESKAYLFSEQQRRAMSDMAPSDIKLSAE